MARRALKPFTPLLVGLVAVAIGFPAIGTSFAGTSSGPGAPPGGVAPLDAPIPTTTTPAPVSTPAVTLPDEAVQSGSPAHVPTHTGKVYFGPKDCVSCMEPPSD